MLGAVIETMAGRRFSELASMLVWKPLGASADAFITVDRVTFGYDASRTILGEQNPISGI